MTEITREFNASTRALTKVERRYAGQALDSLSTTIHFIYNPIDFLAGSSELGVEGYTPYIMFNVFDSNGNPLIYSLSSTPVFDGYTFTIPWDVTSRVKTMSLEYQLYFIRNNVTLDDIRNVAQLDSTEYLISAMDSIALKQTIKCKPAFPNPACCPSAPTTEPGIMGYINLFREYAVMLPVSADVDSEQNRLVLTFPTYNGQKDQELTLNVPYLDSDGKVPVEFLNVITEWGKQSDQNLPSALLVYDSLAEKTDIIMAIEDWDASLTYGVGSTVMGSDGSIYISQIADNIGNQPVGSESAWLRVMAYDAIVNEWAEQPTEDTVPSAMLVKTSLDGKTDVTMAIPFWNAQETYSQGSVVIGSDWRIHRSTQADNIGNDPTGSGGAWSEVMEYDAVINEWDEVPSESKVPSEALMVSALAEKTDMTMAVPFWDAEATYNQGSTVIWGTVLYISLQNGNQGNSPVDDDTWWMPIQGDGQYNEYGTVVKAVGDGVNTQFIIDHNFGTYDVFTALRMADGSGLYVDALVEVLDANSIQVSFSNPPGLSDVVVMVSPAIAPQQAFVDVIGDGESVQFTLKHNFGKYNFFSQVMTNGVGQREVVDANIVAVDPNTAVISFTSPPAQDGIVVILAPAIGSMGDGTYTYTQTEPSAQWVIQHNLGHYATVYVMDPDGNEIGGLPQQDMMNPDVVTVNFSEPVAGVALLR